MSLWPPPCPAGVFPEGRCPGPHPAPTSAQRLGDTRLPPARQSAGKFWGTARAGARGVSAPAVAPVGAPSAGLPQSGLCPLGTDAAGLPATLANKHARWPVGGPSPAQLLSCHIGRSLTRVSPRGGRRSPTLVAPRQLRALRQTSGLRGPASPRASEAGSVCPPGTASTAPS